MPETEIKRLSRLSAMLAILQSKRVLTATAISKKFNISIRTVYRDIRALEQSGIPICSGLDGYMEFTHGADLCYRP